MYAPLPLSSLSTCPQELLKTSLPRNLSPAPPNYEDMRDQSQDATEEQLTMFLNEVKQHAPLPLIRSYLKLYSSVGIDKLAAFCRMETETFRTRLLALKHKSRMTVWKSGPAHSGEEQQCGDVEFYIKVRSRFALHRTAPRRLPPPPRASPRGSALLPQPQPQ